MSNETIAMSAHFLWFDHLMLDSSFDGFLIVPFGSIQYDRTLLTDKREIMLRCRRWKKMQTNGTPTIRAKYAANQIVNYH